MSELKTLKDIGENNSLDYNRPILFKDTFVYNDLRKEAIKWIKETDENGMEKEFNDKYEYWDYGADTKGFIINFFNLTEEDLR